MELSRGCVEQLESKRNFGFWLRDLRRLAQWKGLWELITGTETILEKPFKSTLGSLTQTRLQFDHYWIQQNRITEASSLLYNSLSTTVRSGLCISEHAKPWEAYKLVEQEHEATNYQICQDAYLRIESIEYNPKKTMFEFIDQLIQCQFVIKDAEGEYSDAQLINKIARSLPDEYFDFVCDNIFDVKAMPNINGLTHKLFALEARNLESLEKNKEVASAGSETETPADTRPDTGHKKKRVKYKQSP